MKNSKNNYCNNCGTMGHNFNKCKKPITSLGVVAIKKENDVFKYLMICRKDSLGYIDFLRGKYPIYDESYISNLISEMTNIEKQNILNKPFDELWSDLWGNYSIFNYKSENKTSKEKFLQIKRGIKVDEKQEYDLETLVKKCSQRWDSPEWGFPKGRRNNGENDLTCALREWEEETGYDKKTLRVIKNILPVEEIFMGSNFKTYKHKYYLGFIDSKEKPEYEFQKSEVSQTRWCTLEEALSNIRDYNLEKKNVIIKINSLLNEYRLIL